MVVLQSDKHDFCDQLLRKYLASPEYRTGVCWYELNSKVRAKNNLMSMIAKYKLSRKLEDICF